GRIGLIRGGIAAKNASVGWIGVAETRADRGKEVAARVGAEFVTTDFHELLTRPEVTAAVIATDEHLHVEPILAAVERGVSLLIEKPLATELAESARVLKAHPGCRRGRRRRLYAALPPPLPRRQGKDPHRPAARRDPGDVT